MQRVRSWLGLILTALLAACTQSLDVEEKQFLCSSDRDCLEGYVCLSVPDEPEVSACQVITVLPDSSGCLGCMSTSCAEQVSACLKDRPCEAEFSCIAECSDDDPSCKTRCQNATLAGDGSTLNEFGLCMSSSCASSCDQTCGDIPVFTDISGEPGCRECVESSCCAEASACASDPICREILGCVRAPIPGDQREYCFSKHSEEARARFTEYFNCRKLNCFNTCEPDLSCAGHINTTVPADKDPLEWTFKIRGLEAGLEPLVDAEVRLCGDLDPLCIGPLEVKTSDEDGDVPFLLPFQTGSGTDTVPQQGWAGSVSATHPSGDWLPTRYQAIPFLSAPVQNRTVILISVSLIEISNRLLEDEGAPPLNLEDNGLIFGVINDCLDEPARGLYVVAESTVDPDAEMVHVYTPNGLPTTQASSTGSDGRFLIYNVPEGTVNVRILRRRDDLPVMEGSVYVRKGWSTAMGVAPTPLQDSAP